MTQPYLLGKAGRLLFPYLPGKLLPRLHIMCECHHPVQADDTLC